MTLDDVERLVTQRETQWQGSIANAVLALKASAEAPAVGGTQAWVLKVSLKHNDVVYPPGAEVPFDPKQPPEGCNGLREGVHYHALHVLRAPLAAA